ncbi:Ig-like domain-containing protein [Glacieibacterium sp.]|uniref:Ig-like domain-containing protein n=1 Tax=Glacieibacterium sp. TaxID=2860237 RepID=UPI003B00D419
MATGGELLVNTSTAGIQNAPAAASLINGGFIVTWTDASGQGGDSSGTSIKAQLFDAAGNKTGGEFLANTSTQNGQDSAAVTVLESGAFVITWRDSSLQGGDSSKDSVKAQMFDAAGVKIGGEVLVNTQTLGNQQAPAIAALDTGGYVISWADSSNRGGDLDNFGIKAQVFDANGNRVGGEILANTTTTGAQIQASITPLSFGGFVISWADYSGTGSEQGTAGIKAQMFDDFGQRVGGEVTVNTATLGSQAEPAITSVPGGGFVIGWTDLSGLGGDPNGTSIKTKLFAPLPGQGPPPHILTSPDTAFATEDTAAQFLASSFTVNDRDAANSLLTITSVAAVTGGTVVLNADGTIDFTPNPNFSGRAIFNYTVTDVDGFSATGRVSVDVAAVNDAPIVTDDRIAIGQNGGTFGAAALLANDINVDPGDVLSVVGVSAATANGFALGFANGVITYDPGTTFKSLGAGQTATDSFAYTVKDIAGLTASGTVTLVINGANDAPVSTTLSNNTVDENAANGTVVGTLVGIDPDNGDTLSYSLTNNANGRFIVDAATGIITVANGALLDFETNASHQIIARATDTGGLYVETSYTIALNDLPEAKSFTGDNGVNVFTAGSNDLWTINGLGGNDTLTGNASSDTIYGGAGADLLNGGGGADSLVGGIGNDVYIVDNVGDRVIELAGEGTDQVNSSVSFTLDANVENLTLTGSADINGIGNDVTNTINGNSGNNLIDGGLGKDFLLGNDGNDTIIGGGGADSLQGGAGDDVLIGGAGIDELTGGTGSDQFVFDTLTVSADRDAIKDFVHGVDKLVISESAFAAFAGTPTGSLPSIAFTAGTQATTSDHHLIYNAATGGLFYDPDGVGGAAQVQIAVLNSGAALTYQDIMLIA